MKLKTAEVTDFVEIGGRVSGRLRALPLLVSVSILLVTVMLWGAGEVSWRRAKSTESAVTARQVGLRLAMWIESREALVCLIADNSVTNEMSATESFEHEANRFLRLIPGLHSVCLIDKSWTVRAVYPNMPEDGLLGMNLHTHPSPEMQKALERVMTSEQPTRTRVVSGVLGDEPAMAVYYPAYSPSGELRGAVNGVFELSTLVRECLSEPDLLDNFKFALLEGDRDVVYHHGPDPSIEDWSFVSEVDVEITDRTLRLALAPTVGTREGMRLIGHDYLLLAGVPAALLAFRIMWLLVRRHISLRDSQRRLAHIYASANEGIFVLDPETGIIVDCNRSAVEMLGYTLKELRGMPVSKIHPDEMDKMASFQESVTAFGKARSDELSCTCKDGHKIPVDVSGSLLELNGQSYVLAMARDITERKATEKALHDSEEQHRLALDGADLGTWDVDHLTKTVTVNERWGRMLGYLPRKYKTSWNRWIGMLHPADEEAVRALYKAHLAGESDMFEAECRLKTGQGGWKWVLTRGKVVERDADGAVRRVSGTQLDIDARKEAEKKMHHINEMLEERVQIRTTELQSSNQELEAFCYSVSHDLRTPLRAINGFSQALLEDFGEVIEETGRGYMDRVRAATERMSTLIDDLLRLSRISRGDIDIVTVNLTDVFFRVADTLKESAPERSVEFIGAEDLSVQGDRALMNIVLENLVGNAWKFSAPVQSARIEFGMLRDDPTRDVYYVRDNGVGFDMAYSNMLFGAFQRLHHEEEFEGTGIGLATVERIVQKHGGKVWAESEVGTGSTFYFCLMCATGADLVKSS